MVIVDVIPKMLDNELKVTINENGKSKAVVINTTQFLEYLENVGEILHFDDSKVYFYSNTSDIVDYDSYFVPMYDTECSLTKYLAMHLNPLYIKKFIEEVWQ